MLKHITIGLFIGISFIYADNTQNIEKLRVEKEALLLKLEVYELQQRIIETKNFIENDKIQKEKKRNRDDALIRLKNDLRLSRNNRRYTGHLSAAR